MYEIIVENTANFETSTIFFRGNRTIIENIVFHKSKIQLKDFSNSDHRQFTTFSSCN